jgi:hypothetical protein
LDECSREAGRQRVRGLPACAMGGNDHVRCERRQPVAGRLDDRVEERTAQMESADHGVDALDAGQALRVAQDVDGAGVARSRSARRGPCRERSRSSPDRRGSADRRPSARRGLSCGRNDEFRSAAASVGARPMSLTGTDMCSAISLATLRAKPRSVLSPVVQLEVRGSGNGRASRCIK